MLVNRIMLIKSEAESLRSRASAVAADWNDGVQRNFYNTHLGNIYSITENFYSNAVGYAQSMVSDRGELERLDNQARMI